MSIRTEGAGTLGTLAPFPIGEKRNSSDFNYDSKLGMEIVGPKGRKFRLVQYVSATALAGPAAAGANVAGGRAFAPTAANLDDPLTMHKVGLAQRTGTKPQNRAIGFALSNQDALVQNDYFWLQFDGDYIEMWFGDDGTDVAPGDYVALDDDADLGCVYSLGTTFTVEFMLGVSMSTQAGTDALINVRPYRPING